VAELLECPDAADGTPGADQGEHGDRRDGHAACDGDLHLLIPFVDDTPHDAPAA